MCLIAFVFFNSFSFPTQQYRVFIATLYRGKCVAICTWTNFGNRLHIRNVNFTRATLGVASKATNIHKVNFYQLANNNKNTWSETREKLFDLAETGNTYYTFQFSLAFFFCVNGWSTELMADVIASDSNRFMRQVFAGVPCNKYFRSLDRFTRQLRSRRKEWYRKSTSKRF